MAMPDERLHLMKITAIRAGDIILRYAKGGADYKPDGSVVTEADMRSNEFITGELTRRFPEYGILSEESPDDLGRLGKRKVYIVDPLDGSGDLKRGEDDFCVQIALAEDGEVVLGVVYEPSKKRLFSGQKGWQALLAQDVTLRGDDTYDASEGVLSPLKPVAWQDAIVGHPKSYKGDKYQQLYKWLCIPESRLRKSGSMGTRMMQVALGETHMILGYTRSLNEWDVAAGHAVLEARGMSVTDVQGNPVRYNKGIPKTGNGILVAHPDIKWDLLHHIKGCLPLVPL